ncbi:bifunctional NAD(P)/FAD-dependent oxidoreductase/class I SAM-dependent methyltransferase [Nonomuraea sp. NBC_00507]|uniref:bifunctional NAD(P)/FAD-dependent oxidoreductase/class I SAM-dependent methyltransferase n=1 Tax=Nonomuraea sp. NBC_00507 TaxID=2976002 RepID=UPI002E1975F7
MNTKYDVVVVGGGAAGLSGALTLGRARRKVLVIDAGQPRNAPAAGVHTYLTREGMPPRELLAAGREEVIGYGGEIVTGTVVAAERVEDGFRMVLDDGSAVAADRLLLATGLVDELPDVPGLAERWGRDVLHCPYCHGWEVRDQAIGVLATGPLAVHQALLWRQWSDQVTLFLHTGPEPDAEQREQLAARDVAVVEGRVAGLEVTGDRLAGVRLADGTVVECRALAVATRLTAREDLLAGLGLETEEQEMGGHVIGTRIPADAMGATNVPGVWVVGNAASVTDQVIVAAAGAVRVAAAINADLIAEETRRAVTARRAGSAAAESHGGSHAQSHGESHGESHGGSGWHGTALPPEEFWDAFYAEKAQVWSGNPNVALVREAAGLEPGTALDLGCGEGADAIWLARRGWRVTAADISHVALERAAEHARDAEVAGRIDWQRHDLGMSFPEGSYDLVSACYLHAPTDLPREKILRAAAAAVAPGGVLLVVGHAGWPSWEHNPPAEVHLPTPQEVLDALEPAEGEWEVLRSEEFERTQDGPDGRAGARKDNLLKLRRLP